MKPKTWINWVGAVIYYPSLVVLLVLCYKVSPWANPPDTDKLMHRAVIVSMITFVSQGMYWHQKKPKRK